MPKNRKWGDLSKQARDRAERAGREYGLNRNATAKRYNRGTYNPLARDPIQRLPRELRARADAEGNVDWRAQAERNIAFHLSDYAKYNEHAVVFFTQNMAEDTARIVALATEDELLQYASPQADAEGNPPPIENWGLPPSVTLADVSVYIDGQWNNVFWYH
jgi:hypothetical protein